jgi:hypothetical protein
MCDIVQILGYWQIHSEDSRGTDFRAFLQTIGCETLVVDSTFPRSIEMLFLFMFLRCNWRTVLVGNMLTATVLIFANVATGSWGWHTWCRAALHVLVGSVVMYLCHVGTQESRKQFAWSKNVKLAANQSQRALYTLIPPNVLARLACHSDDMGILATEIEHCSIMFVSLHCEETHGRRSSVGGDKEDFYQSIAVY